MNLCGLDLAPPPFFFLNVCNVLFVKHINKSMRTKIMRCVAIYDAELCRLNPEINLGFFLFVLKRAAAVVALSAQQLGEMDT